MTAVPLHELPKYNFGDKVKVTGWTSSATGEIVDIDWIYHHRLGEHTWGYNIKFDAGQDNPLTFTYIPQGYVSLLS